MSNRQSAGELGALVEPVVAEAGLDMEDISVRPAGRRQLVRVTVDRDGGVTADELAETSRAVSRALDEADPLGPGSYTLEISSPGVDRPLAEPRHWRRAATRLVRVPLRGVDGQAGEAYGRVVSADNDGVILEKDGHQHRYSYEELGAGRIEVELRRRKPDREPADGQEDAR
ncbi:MAG: ribosome maturation factor RimP [Streptosporangiales bacterium]